MLKPVAAVALALCAVCPASAQFTDIFKGLGKKGSTQDSNKIGAGLKEALSVATGGAVQSTGTIDGYFNEAIKILMPEKLRAVDRTLRMIGMSGPMDEFILSMNRAAEQAAPQAKPVFLDAIKAMTFDDARKILSGGDTAATDYFRSKTTATLSAAFRPSVVEAMQNVGVTKRYEDMVKAIPFGKPAALDIDGYVVDKAVAGLFYMVGEGEKKIRKDPLGQASSLLREVFGGKP